MTKELPQFRTVEEESDFWDEQDLTDFMTGPQLRITSRHAARGVLPVRLSPTEVRRVRALARQKHMGVATLLSSWITERLRHEKA